MSRARRIACTARPLFKAEPRHVQAGLDGRLTETFQKERFARA
jgi:hypothetical protein